MQPQLFHQNTAADNKMLLNAAVPMVWALPRGGAARFTRSTTGCGNLGGPKAASLWPQLQRADGSPGLRLPSYHGQQRKPALTSDLCLVSICYMHGI